MEFLYHYGLFMAKTLSLILAIVGPYWPWLPSKSRNPARAS